MSAEAFRAATPVPQNGEMTIRPAETDGQIAATFDVMAQLRPHLARDEYVPLVRRMMESDGYRLAALIEGDAVRAVAGYRFMTMLYRGRLLYVDDLVTDENARSRGHGSRLLDWLQEEGRKRGCSEMQLISRDVRKDAHRFYLREGFTVECLHFRREI